MYKADVDISFADGAMLIRQLGIPRLHTALQYKHLFRLHTALQYKNLFLLLSTLYHPLSPKEKIDYLNCLILYFA